MVKNSKLEFPVISFGVSDVDVNIDTGELLFPVFVLFFCAAYYTDTRGLPARSMIYAEPLLYATVLLSMLTISAHAVSFDKKVKKGSSDDASPFISWGESIEKKKSNTPLDDENEKNEFGIKSAISIAVILIGYIISLYLLPFVIATVGFLLCCLYVFGERNPLRIVVYAVGFTALSWAIFIEWLFVPLP
jgi:hypothetical protein